MNSAGPRLASRSFKPMTIGFSLTILMILIANIGGLVSLAYAGGCDTTTTTSLALSSNTLVAGSSVLLTATVVADPPPVTRGLVIFCDATAARCDGAAVLGTAQLTSAGTATLALRLGVGTYSIDAIYEGYAAYAVLASTSTAQALTVNGNPDDLYLSTTAIGATGSIGNYTLAGTTSAFGKPPMAATISFIDTTNNNVVAASAALDPTTLGRNFLPSAGSPITGQQNMRYVVSGDFNNDGIPDLVIANDTYTGTISISLGVGDGTFQTAVPYSVGSYPQAIAVSDLNGDGNLDLVVTNEVGTVSILLGNGDGTFQAQTTLTVGSEPHGVAVADFNRDGIEDLVVANNGGNTVSVLLGVGNGTFQTQVVYAVGVQPIGVAVGDFNNDGLLDLAVGNREDQTVSILLGAGNGTFGTQTVVALANNVYPFYLTTGDLRQNGTLDLVIPSGDRATVCVLLGNNDGSFQAPVLYPVGAAPDGLALGDVNNDGILDLVAADTGEDGKVSVLIGNGDGTFAAKTDYNVGNGPVNIALADYNGDGLLDIATANQANSASILLQRISETATATGVAVYGVGTDYVLASYPGDSGRASSVSATVPLLDSPQTATTTALNSSANPANSGQPVTFTATVAPVPTGTPTGTVSFYNGAVLLGTATVNSSGVAAFTTSSLSVGAAIITATYSGNAGFLTSTSTPLIENVTQITTTTTLTASPSPATVDQPITLTATVNPAPTGSAGTVSFYNGATLLGTSTVNSSGIATFTADSLPAGTDNLTAVFSGNAGFAGSTSSVLALTVSPEQVTYTISASSTPYAIAQGGSVNIPITVPPLGGAYNAVVTLSVTGLPSGATATFNPPTVVPGSTGAQTVMTVTLEAKAVNVPARLPKFPVAPFAPAGVALALCGAAFVLIRVPRKLRLAGALAGFAGVAMLIAGCSGGFAGGPSTALGSYVLTVTGTSGSHHPSTTVTIVVK